MNDEARVLELVELALSTERSPEEICATQPELLSEVQRRLRRCLLVDAELDAIFPRSVEYPASDAPIPLAIPGYEIDSVIGRGGMGIVYKARQLALGRTVAIKTLLAGDFASSSQRVRFLREAEAVAGLSNPAIVQIYDFGYIHGRPYYAMEFVNGRNLAEVLHDKKLSTSEAAKFALDVSNAMEQAHAQGIVHRDLKPANLLLTPEGTLKVTDFGLARKLDDASRLTLTGDTLGTLCYMAPEQVQGNQDDICIRTDIFAIGVILYEMLTGRTPFGADNQPETLRLLLQEEPIPPRQFNLAVPLDLQTICLKCLEKSSERRYTTCSALSEDLRRMLSGRPITARPVGTIEQTQRWANRNRGLATALGTGMLAVVVTLVGSIVAASHFRRLANENEALANQKSVLADESERQRLKTVDAERNEQQLRMKAESLANEMRRTLYLTEMRLISQSADTPGGMNRLSERLAAWDLGQPDVREWEWGYFNGLLNQCEAVLPAHAQGVQHVALSPSSDRLLTVGGDQRACIWSVADHQLLLRFSGHSASVMAGAWSPNGELAATADNNGLICVWKTASGELVNRWSASKAPLQAVTWSPDGSRIATTGWDRLVRIWDVESHELLHELTGHEDRIMTLDWSSSGRLASGSLDMKILIWDLDNETVAMELQGHKGWVRDVKWSPDGRRLASASSDRSAVVWDVLAGVPSLHLAAKSLGVKSIAWSPDGKLLATGGDDQLAQIWSTDDGTPRQTLTGHSQEVNSISWGKVLITGSLDGEVRLWSESTLSKTAMRRLPQNSPLHCLKWSPVDRTLLVAGGAAGKLFFCTGDNVESAIAGNSTIVVIAWQNSGKLLAVLGRDGKVYILDAASRKVVQTLPDEYSDTRAIAWSPDGCLLAAGASDGSVRTWRIEDLATTHSLESPSDSISVVAWSPDGSQLAVASSVGYVKLLAADTLHELRRLRERSFGITDLTWSPDGDYLAIAAQQDAVEIWRLTDVERVALLHGNKSHPAKIAWSPNGRRIALAGRDGSIRVWDFETNREVTVFGEQQNRSHAAVDWNCDGFSLASCSERGEIVVYDARYGFFAAKSHHLLPALDNCIENKQDFDDLRIRGLVYARLHDIDRASEDFETYLSHANLPWIIADCYVAGPYSIFPDQSGSPELVDNRNSNPLIPPRSSSWQRVQFIGHGFVNFGRLFDLKANVSGYAYLPIYCHEERDVLLLLGSDDQLKVWLNGSLIHETKHSRTAIPGQDQIPTRLRKGWNRVLVRVSNVLNHHILCFEIEDGAPATDPPSSN